MPPNYATPEVLESGVIRVLAQNPSPMTFEGTCSYVLGDDVAVVIDPGPALPDHLSALESAVAARTVAAVIVTHSHLDHSPGARALAARLSAPVLGFGPSGAGRSATMRALADLGGGEGVDRDFAPDRAVAASDVITFGEHRLRVRHIPGHMANHIALEWLGRRLVWTGDTVMGWASTMISPPDGDLGQFMASLDTLEQLKARRFFPGHGDPVDAPSARCHALRDHRLGREAAILGALDAPTRIPDLVARIYADTPPALHGAAARNVLAHLIHLSETNRVRADGPLGPDVLWRRL